MSFVPPAHPPQPDSGPFLGSTPGPPSPTSSRKTMSQRLRLAIPLVCALALCILFVVFLVLQANRTDESSLATPPAAVAAAAVESDWDGYGKLPEGPPEAPDEAPRVSKRRGKDGLFRWNLSDYPEGWDAEIALSVHNYFETMMRLEKAAPGPELDALREEFAAYLAGLGPDALPTFGAILNAESDFVFRRFMLYAIGDLGPQSEDATYMLKDYFMARQRNPKSLSEVKHVLRAMGRLQNDTSFDVLQNMTWDEELAPHRKNIVEQLGDHVRRDEAVDFFVDGLRKDTHTMNRNKWAQAIKKLRNPDTLGDLYRAFEKERYWGTQQTILGAIGATGSSSAVPFLESKARHHDTPAVRLSAARALWRIGTPYAGEVLSDLQRTEPDPKIRKLIESWESEER